MGRTTNTGFKGVTRRGETTGSRFESTVNIQGRRVFSKGTQSIQEAVEARKQFILNLL